mgnify:CR=1 FL=1
MAYDDDNNRGGREETIPSYKTPGVYPSGSDISLGISNTDLLQGSLGNWNNLVRDSDSQGNQRTFISFASNSDLTIPSISGEGLEGRPIFVSITEQSIFNNGVQMVGVEGITRNKWYQEGDSGFQNRQRYNRERGVITKKTTNFSSQFYPFTNVRKGYASGSFGNLARYPFDVIDEYYWTQEEIEDWRAQRDPPPGGNWTGPQTGISTREKIEIHELVNRWLYVVTHYWDVTIGEAKSFLQFIDNTPEIGYSSTMDKWNEIFGGKFKSELFENPIGLDSNLFYISQNLGAVEKLAEDEINGPFPTNYKIEFNSDDVLLWERGVDSITGQFPIRFLDREDAFFFTSTSDLILPDGWEDKYEEYYAGDYELHNAFAPGENYGSGSTELLIFPKVLNISLPSEVFDPPEGKRYGFKVQTFPVQSENNPLSNFIGNFTDTTTSGGSGNLAKFGFPYFSYDYIFSSTFFDGIDGITPPVSSLDIDDFQVDCYTSVDGVDTTLKYYEIGTEEYRKTSFPLEVDLNLKLIDSSNVDYTDPIGSGFDIQSTFSLVDLLYANESYVQSILATSVFNPPFHFRYDVIQWGDEDVLLTDEQIEASFYFNMYDIESYPPDSNSYEYKKFVQSHIKSKPANSISKHVYNSPGVKRLRIIAYKMSRNGVFVLQTYLIQKNIVVSDGNLSAQDFAVFGLGNYKYLPIKENQAVIGGLTADSDYNESISTILKDNNFIEEDYLERVSSVRYLQKFNQGLLGESSADTISSDIGQVRVFNTPKDIYSFIGGDRLDIINNGLSTLPINSSATDILIDNDNCIVDFNPPNNELFSIQNQAGKDEIGVIVGDYKVVQPKTSRIRRDGDMNRPEIITEKDRQAF